MSDDHCACCGPTAEESVDSAATTETAPDGGTIAGEPAEGDATADRWLDGRPVTSEPLPPAVADAMSRFLDERIDTLDDFVAAAREATGGGGLAVEDLCHAGEETPHRATVDGETYYFRCFYDGVALSYLADEPVEISTESASGDPIEMRASPDGDIDATPSDAVMSFGITADVDALAEDDRPMDEVVVGAMCPYVKAFSTRERYERWAATVDAETVGMPIDAGVPIAAALVE